MKRFRVDVRDISLGDADDLFRDAGLVFGFKFIRVKARVHDTSASDA
jgi:hypothetical protein